jgi:hypothetical protein
MVRIWYEEVMAYLKVQGQKQHCLAEMKETVSVRIFGNLADVRY